MFFKTKKNLRMMSTKKREVGLPKRKTPQLH